MSWLARSLANSLRLNDDAHPENDVAPESARDLSAVIRKEEKEEGTDAEETEAQGRGVKEDLTELKQTLTRQLWGVASFLAPPPTGNDSPIRNLNQSEPSDRSEYCDEGEPLDSAGIMHDFAEIRGRFRSGVTEISKMASNYFPFGSEENEGDNQEENEGDSQEENEGDKQEEKEGEYEELDDWGGGGGGGAIGVTDEVLAFAWNIAMHPETWLDFPLDEEEDLDDFQMSDAQREHTLAIDQYAPRLAALRIELCPCHMTLSYFWKVYFVLLHSRLNKHDAEILSTPQVMEARAIWMRELHKKTNPESYWNGRSSYVKDRGNIQFEDIECTRTFDFERTTSTTDCEAEKHPIASMEMPFVDKSVIEEKPVIKTDNKFLPTSPCYKAQIPNYEDDEDDWPDEEDSDLGGYKTTIPIGNEEDISFSDLEDDASSTMPVKFKTLSKGADT